MRMGIAALRGKNGMQLVFILPLPSKSEREGACIYWVLNLRATTAVQARMLCLGSDIRESTRDLGCFISNLSSTTSPFLSRSIQS